MFTGIIQEIGVIQRITLGGAFKLHISAKEVVEDVELGDSISVDGACLTVVEFSNEGFVVDAMPETIEKTTLKYFVSGTRVNLESSLRVGSKMGGHWVLGHVDGVGKILSKTKAANSVVYEISIPNELAKYLIPKGSVAVDGISLTLIECGEQSFKLGLIPHSFDNTTLGEKGVGAYVNLETDVVGKYIYKFVKGDSEGSVTEDLLREAGFM